MPLEYLIIEHLTTKDLARIFSKIQISTENFYNSTPCWDWQAYKDKGYGATSLGKTYISTHRLMYAWLVAPLPKGQGRNIPVLDHLCRRPSCCNPLHLELVSNRTNLMRGESPSAVCARKTECKNGHPLSGENLYIRPTGERSCRTCRQAEAQRIKQRRQSNPEYQERYRQVAREGARRRYADPEKRKRHQEINNRCRQAKRKQKRALA